MTASGPTPRRRAAVAAGLAAALAALMALLTTSLTAAAVLPTAWTITATPLTLTQGQAADVTLTVTGGTDRIRCLLVSVPADYEVLDASVVTVPTGETLDRALQRQWPDLGDLLATAAVAAGSSCSRSRTSASRSCR